MRAGWAAQKQAKWADAVREFEAAVTAIDGDERALAELGFSAMSVGDLAKARRADEQAVQVAADKRVKAAALYNLGLVLDKSGDHDGALRSMRASVALRPNHTVEQAIAGLGAPAAAELATCTAGEDACACVERLAFDDAHADGAHCAPSTSPPPVSGFRVIHVEREFHSERWDYLLDEHGQLAAVIAGSYMYRMGSVMDDLALDKVVPSTVGAHHVLWIQTTESLDERDDSAEMPAMTRTTRVTLCVQGDAATPTRCPLRDVPIAEAHDDTQTKLELAIGDDGTATVKLVSGASDSQIAALIGAHHLW